MANELEGLYDQLETLWDDFQTNHNKYDQKGTKAAAGRARKSLGEIKKLVTPYRQASVIKTK